MQIGTEDKGSKSLRVKWEDNGIERFRREERQGQRGKCLVVENSSGLWELMRKLEG